MATQNGIPHLVRLADRLDIYRLSERHEARIFVLHGEHLSRAISAGSSAIGFVADSPHTYVALANEIRRLSDDGVLALYQSHTESRFLAMLRLRAFQWLCPERADPALNLQEKFLVLQTDERIHWFEEGDYPFETDSQQLEALAVKLLQAQQ